MYDEDALINDDEAVLVDGLEVVRAVMPCLYRSAEGLYVIDRHHLADLVFGTRRFVAVSRYGQGYILPEFMAEAGSYESHVYADARDPAEDAHVLEHLPVPRHFDLTDDNIAVHAMSGPTYKRILRGLDWWLLSPGVGRLSRRNYRLRLATNREDDLLFLAGVLGYRDFLVAQVVDAFFEVV